MLAHPYRPGASYTITTVTTGSTPTASAVSTGVKVVRLVASTQCHVAIGVSPTAAVATGMVVLANAIPEYFKVNPGEKIAAIADTTGGTLYISEMSL